jgi:predicted RND superfamily exporter protein
MNKKQRLKELYYNAVNRLSVCKVKYYYVLMNEDIRDVRCCKRITNKELIKRMRKIDQEIEKMEDEIKFICEN